MRSGQQEIASAIYVPPVGSRDTIVHGRARAGRPFSRLRISLPNWPQGLFERRQGTGRKTQRKQTASYRANSRESTLGKQEKTSAITLSNIHPADTRNCFEDRCNQEQNLRTQCQTTSIWFRKSAGRQSILISASTRSEQQAPAAHHSWCRAAMGSMRVARRAGIYVANMATATIATGTMK